jgi:Uma2 family endonuclease
MRFKDAMEPDTGQVSADDLMRMPDDGYSYELVLGRLIRMPKPGALHGIVGMRLMSALVRHVEEHHLGVLFPQDTGFKLTSDPDTVRAPDLAFVGRDKIALIGLTEGFWPGAPDLAVEVRSPHNSMRELTDKAREYQSFGSRLVWIIDPRQQQVMVFRPGREPVTLSRGDVLSGADVVPGFELPVTRLFE